MIHRHLTLTVDGVDYVAVPRAEYDRMTRAAYAPAKGLAGRDAVAYMTQSIGRDLRAERVAAKLTQADLAERLAVTTSHISNCEAGRERVSEKFIVRWEKACKKR